MNNRSILILIFMVVLLLTVTACPQLLFIGKEQAIGMDTTAPPDVTGLRLLASDRSVTVAWDKIDTTDLAIVEITYELTDETDDAEVVEVNAGETARFIDGLTNGQKYTFIVKTIDEAGNKSAGDTQTAVPVGKNTVIFIQPLPDYTKDTSNDIILVGLDVVQYKYRLDSATDWDSLPAHPVSNIIHISGLSDDAHVIEAIGQDSESTWQDYNNPTSMSWRVDTTPPVVTINETFSGKYKTDQSISVTVTDATPVTSIVWNEGAGQISFSAQGQLSTTMVLPAASIDQSFDITCQVTDSVGNIGTGILPGFHVDKIAPGLISLDSNTYKYGATTLSWVNPSDYDFTALRFDVDPALFNHSVPIGFNGTTYEFYGMDFGSSHSITINSLDDIGNMSTITTFDQFTGKGTAQSIPQVSNSRFGSAVAVSGGWMAVGAPYDGGHGTVYFFQWNGTQWDFKDEETKIGPGDGAEFGTSIAMDYPYIVIGSPGVENGKGEVYTYRYSTGWGGEKDFGSTLLLDNSDRFGESVALGANHLFVGAPRDDGTGNTEPDSGALYIYERQGLNDYTILDELRPAVIDDNDEFGRDVAWSANRIIVGAPGTGTNGQGKCFFFSEAGGTYTTAAGEITRSGAAAGDRFGQSVDIFNNRAAVGAYGADNGVSDAGGVYIFEDNTGWSEVEQLYASDRQINDHFGYSVAMDGDWVIVGAPDEDGGTGNTRPDTGAVYLYHFNVSSNWVQTGRMSSSTFTSRDYFGRSVDINEGYITAGAVQDYAVPGSGLVEWFK